MLYVWLRLISQLLLLLPNRRTVSLHCRDGSIRYQRMRVLASISLFPRLFSRPFKVYTNFTAEVYSYFYTVNNSSSVPINHGLAATLAYVNRELTNALVSLVSPRGPYRREEEHAMRYYSGGLGQRFVAIPSPLGWTWLLEKKCEYNCAQSVSISPPKSEPPRPEALVIATPCDFFRALACAFAPALERLLLSTSDDVHLLTTMFNSTTPARTLLQKYNVLGKCKRCSSLQN